MTIEVKNFPVPSSWGDLPYGTIAVRTDSTGRALVMRVRFNDGDFALVLAQLDGKGAHADQSLPYLENEFGAVAKLAGAMVVRPRNGIGIANSAGSPDGSLAITPDGKAAVKVHFSAKGNDIAHFDLETGRGVHVVNCVYYRDWEIVLIDGDEELVLATFLPATEGHKPGFG